MNIFTLKHPEGGNCGGFAVNDLLEKLLLDIFKITLQQFNQLKINCSVQWVKMMNEDFESYKLMLDPDDHSLPLNLEFHTKICTQIEQLTGKSIEDLVEDYDEENIEWDEDESSLVLHVPVIHKIFQPVLDDVCKLVKKVLEKPSCQQIGIVLLVGGFSESALLFRKVEESFPGIRIYRSSDPKFSVAKGAVLCGQHHNLVKPVLENMKIDGNPYLVSSTISDSPPDAILQPDSDDYLIDTFTDVAITGKPSGQVTKHLPPNNSTEITEQLSPPIAKHLPPTYYYNGN